MTPEQRKEAASKAALAKSELARLPKATHGGEGRPLKIGDFEITCYVLDNDVRVLTQRGLQTSIGMSIGGGSKPGEQRLVSFLSSLSEKLKQNNCLSLRSADLSEKLRSPIKFRLPSGGAAFGFEATILADVCDVILAARKLGALQKQQERLADQAEYLVRGFARVGIIALVDEATGYQKDRANEALAKILEAYIAKELQPWVKTFDSRFYEGMFRLRGLPYPPETRHLRPQYFGKLTNDIVYSRLAPGVLEALKREGAAAEKKGKLHQHLTAGYGRQELLKHLGSVTTMMLLSSDWPDFMAKLNRICPRIGTTYEMALEEVDR